MSEASLEQNLAAARDEHLVPGRELHLPDLRGSRFCEVGLITGTSKGNAVANIWNTTGACDPTSEQFGALDAEAIARANGAMLTWLNPVRQWMVDRLDVWEAGDDKSFGEITGTWRGVIDAAALMQAADQPAYDAGYVYSNGTVTFSEDSEVYLLDAPDGEVFIMQSISLPGEPAVREPDLTHLSRRLALPEHWGFRARRLDQDLTVSANPDSLAHVLQDDLHNLYLGSDVGRAFSQLTPEDSLW